MDQAPPPVLEICCVGAGRIGVLSMLVMASNCQNVSITITDMDASKVVEWSHNMGIVAQEGLMLPIYEPGLQELFMIVKNTGRFLFNEYVAPSIEAANVIFIAVDLPLVKPRASSKRRKELANLDFVCRICKDIPNFENKSVITLSSIPPDFKDRIRQIFENSHRFLYNPPYMRNGTALADLQNPPEVVIAYDTTDDILPPNVNVNNILEYTGVNQLRDLYLQWVPENHIRLMNGFARAALGKFATNICIGNSIATANSLSDACTAWGVGFSEVSDSIRRHPDLLNPFNTPQNVGVVGFGGDLVDDISHMSLMANSNNRNITGAFYSDITRVNEMMKTQVVNVMQSKMNSLKDKRIGILGFTNTLNTDDIKNSPAIQICKEILKNGASSLQIFDPKARPAKIRGSFTQSERIKISVMSSAALACQLVDSILILVNWPEFVQLQYVNIAQLMNPRSRKDIFVGRHFANFPDLVPHGFRVHYIGRQ